MTNLWTSLFEFPNRWQRRTSGRYRPEIDGLRFFAIAIVVVCHAVERLASLQPKSDSAFDKFLIKLCSTPGNGVFLFFAISGFIITSQYLKEKPFPLSRDFLGKYFKRRLLRIEPPYMIVLAVTYLALAATHWVPSGTHRFGQPPASMTVSFFSSVLYSHGWLFGTLPKIFPPGWSLEIEVQFYLLAPLFFLGYFAIKNIHFRTLLTLALIVACGLFHVPDESKSPVGNLPHLYYTICNYLAYFWIGILAADLRTFVERVSKRNWIATLTGFSGVLLLIGGAFYGPHLGHFSNVLLRSASIGMMFVGCFTPGCGFHSFVSRPWISFIGGACYSIYLTHLVVIQVVTGTLLKVFHARSLALSSLSIMVVEVPIVLIVALAFYGLIERTFMLPDWPQLLLQKLALKRKSGERPGLETVVEPELSR